MTNNPPSLTLKQLHLLNLNNGDKLLSYDLLHYGALHIQRVCRIPYRFVFGDEPQSILNQNIALHTIKSTSQQIGTNITNLEEFEPVCPNCQSQELTEDIPGELCCHNCGSEGPKSEFFIGGI